MELVEDPLAAFLGPLLFEGRAVVNLGSAWPTGPSPQAISILESAFAIHALSVPGPSLEFSSETAVVAAEVVRVACLALVDRSLPFEELARRLSMPGPPSSPSDHLSADLTFRLLPRVYRRARGLGPSDPLVGTLADLLRAWPLSGVLTNIDEAPTTPLDFGGHAGLMALYAERLILHDRATWYPEGPVGAHLELARWAAAKTRHS